MHTPDLWTRVPGVRVAQVCGESSEGTPIVDLDGEPRPAQVVWMERPPDWKLMAGARVLIAADDDDIERPIVVALLDPPRRYEDLLAAAGGNARPRQVKLESEEELVLECGRAKIALRADGRITILGGHVVSRSTGVNKIQGGSIHIN